VPRGRAHLVCSPPLALRLARVPREPARLVRLPHVSACLVRVPRGPVPRVLVCLVRVPRGPVPRVLMCLVRVPRGRVPHGHWRPRPIRAPPLCAAPCARAQLPRRRRWSRSRPARPPTLPYLLRWHRSGSPYLRHLAI